MSLELYTDPRKSGNLLEIDESSDSQSGVATPQQKAPQSNQKIVDSRIEMIEKQTKHIVEMFSGIAGDITSLHQQVEDARDQKLKIEAQSAQINQQIDAIFESFN